MAATAVPSIGHDPEELTLRLERLGGRLMDLAREGPGKKIAPALIECVQELRAVWSALRNLALVFDANRVEKMLEHENELRQAMEILNGTVGSLSRANVRTEARVVEQIHEIDELAALGDANPMTERLRCVTGTVHEVACEMRDDIVRSAASLGESEQIIQAVDRQLRESRKQVMYDSLTRVLNRVVFEQRLSELAAQPRGITGVWCMTLVAVDDLKAINRLHGRKVGDALLFRVAEIVQAVCDTHPGSFVGRWAGEEFAIVFPRCPLREGRQMAEEIRGAIGLAKWECKAASARVVIATTATLAVVEHHDGESGEALVRRAEHCLDRAVRHGSNSISAEG